MRQEDVQMGGQALLADAVKGGEVANVPGAGGVAGGMGLDAGDHEILGGVFGGNELKNLGAPTGPFQQLGPQGVGEGAPLGLGAPWLGARFYGRAKPVSSAWSRAALLGAAAALVVLGAIALFGAPIEDSSPKPASLGFALKGLLASPYGAVVEEIELRVFVMGLFAWLLSRLAGKQAKPWLMLAAIALAALAFGAGHLSMAAQLVPLTFGVVARVVAYNAFAGFVFGWLYWKRGLEHAMLAHFCADLVLHVAAPLLA